MKQIFLVYKTDNRHSYASRDLIGAVTTSGKAVALCKKKAEREGCKLDEYQIFKLHNYRHTQGYEGDGEFHFEEVDVNALL